MRPDTADQVGPTGVVKMRVKRCCNGCGRQLGDATEDELEAAIFGRELPDVRDECGCSK